MSKPYRSCSCRAPSDTDPETGKKVTGKLVGKSCPKMKDSKHGHWYSKYEAPPDADGKRRQVRLGPFGTRGDAQVALDEARGEVRKGTHATDRTTTLAQYLDRWMSEQIGLKPRTKESYAEAFRLYWIPALGHMRLAKSMPVNPAKGATGTTKGSGGKARKVRPLLWTEPRVERWRKTGKRPAPVMVWTREQTRAFLDSAESDRLYPLYHLAAYWGLRRSELAGLEWSDLDLSTRRLHVRQAQAADELDTTKSDDNDRIITIDQATAEVLQTWHDRQFLESVEWDTAWVDSARVFTREDGSPLRPAYISEHFGMLARRADARPSGFTISVMAAPPC